MLGIIGGSGLYQLPETWQQARAAVKTRYGGPSGDLIFASSNTMPRQKNSSGYELCFLARHGEKHFIPPHKINYRANIQAMVDAGVTRIIAFNSVGSCHAGITTGSLLIPEQIIDYTYGREHSFFDASDEPCRHVDFTEPFCTNLRNEIFAALSRNTTLKEGGVYGCTQGPRLETAAEIARLARDGCDIVGMTLMPEAALARERELPYAALCAVVNQGAGIESGEINRQEMNAVLKFSSELLLGVLPALIR